MRHLPWLTLCLAGFTAWLFAAAGPAAPAWVFDRGAIAAGEGWRLVSAHWVHSDTAHLGWNLVALLILGGIVEYFDRRVLLGALLTGTLAVDAAIWALLPGMSHYCGLSGVLNTLLIGAVATIWRHSRSPLPLVVGVLALVKILVEGTAGHALLTDTAWDSVPHAHLAGWIAGLWLVYGSRLHQPQTMRRSTQP